ncbi:MAG: hypothetical protein Q9219_002475 [cf. Caloplaca sp. 3 TL-2023]
MTVGLDAKHQVLDSGPMRILEFLRRSSLPPSIFKPFEGHWHWTAEPHLRPGMRLVSSWGFQPIVVTPSSGTLGLSPLPVSTMAFTEKIRPQDLSEIAGTGKLNDTTISVLLDHLIPPTGSVSADD